MVIALQLYSKYLNSKEHIISNKLGLKPGVLVKSKYCSIAEYLYLPLYILYASSLIAENVLPIST